MKPFRILKKITIQIKEKKEERSKSRLEHVTVSFR